MIFLKDPVKQQSSEIKNHRLSQFESDHSGPSGPTSLLKQDHSRAHGTGLLSKWFLNISREGQSPTSLVLSHLHSKDLHIQVELPVHWFLPIASSPIVCHH